MVVMNLKLDGIYGFSNFEINFSYPKKIVNSIIEDEHLSGFPQFRYRKAVILMGANATGKTSLGRALAKIFGYLNSGNSSLLLDMVSPDENGSFCIDLVSEAGVLHRYAADIIPHKKHVEVTHTHTAIKAMDSYESCAKRFGIPDRISDAEIREQRAAAGDLPYRFAYPEIESTLRISGVEKKTLLKALRAVIGTLDPTLTDVSLSKDLKDSYIIRRKGTEIIVQDGKLLNREMLSSGTAEGIDVAIFLASMLGKSRPASFYYCDEHFSFIQSDIEKRIFGLMVEYLGKDEQLIFTTHNTDMLDLNLPKHAFIFLRKRMEEGEYRISAVSASDILKRNTDSIRCAVENDVFGSLPDDSLLDGLEKEDTDEE